MENIDLREMLGSEPSVLKRGDDRYVLKIVGRPPCSVGCPAGINVKSYVSLIFDMRYGESLGVVRRANPFPGVCGRVCTAPCEEECALGESPIAIKMLKRFVADNELDLGGNPVEPFPRIFREKVAVIGAGPAGLTAAADLARTGFEVTVFERAERPGGMLCQGIPSYRLPKDVVDHETERIESMGVKIVRGEVEEVANLFEKGYDAAIIAVGACKGRSLSVPGSDREGVLECLSFLRNVNVGQRIELEGRVVVIGGGSSAFDAARVALRSGAEHVTVAYRRGREEMPATGEEVNRAEEEGIELITLASPKEIVGDERVRSVVFLRTELGEEDGSGRRRFIPLRDTEFALDADTVISAIGASPEIPDLVGELERTGWGTLKTDEKGRTSGKGVFACGDAITGPSTIVEAIGSGHAAAWGVYSYLKGTDADALTDSGSGPDDQEVPYGNTGIGGVGGVGDVGGMHNRSAAPKPEMFGGKGSEMVRTGVKARELDPEGKVRKKDVGKRVESELLPREKRIKGFDEVEQPLSGRAVVREASRCLTCGSCHECDVCLSTCDWYQIHAVVNDRSFLIRAPASLRDKVAAGNTDWSLGGGGGRALELSSMIPVVRMEKCLSCGICEEVCSYEAIRVRLTADGAEVELNPDLCRSCGACAAACPSGALRISQFSMKKLADKGRRILDERPGDSVTVASHWTASGADIREDIVEVMGNNCITPFLLIEILASGAIGVAIITPGHEPGHYVGEADAGTAVEKTRDILRMIGIDPGRLVLRKFHEKGKVSGDLKVVPGDLEDEQLFPDRGPLPENPEPPTHRTPPFERAIEQLEWLSKEPDLKPDVPPFEPGAHVALTELLGKLFCACSAPVLGDAVRSVQNIVEMLDMSGSDATMSEIARRMLRRLGSLGFVGTGDGSMRKRDLEGTSEIVLVRCPGDEEFGAPTFKEILSTTMGYGVPEVRAPRSGREWFRTDGTLRSEADVIFKEAEDVGASILVTMSPFATAGLGLANREGSWKRHGVKVMDVFTFLSKCLSKTLEDADEAYDIPVRNIRSG